MENNIKYLGLKNLDSFEIAKLNDLTDKFYPKIERKLAGAKLSIHIKVINPEGKRKNFEIKAKIDSTELGIKSVEQSDWDLARALHKVFENMENLIQNSIKESRSKKKTFKV